jgi:Flp pilus assembly protein TadB
MSSYVPPWSQWPGPRYRGAVPDPQMRVSDAERSEIAETLSKHYSDGRLDQSEFNERLQRAMSAKTRGDLADLLVDLPPIVAAPPPEVQRGHRRNRFAMLLLVTFLFAVLVSSTMWTFHFPWILLAIVLFVLWRRARWGWGWRRRRYGPWY